LRTGISWADSFRPAAQQWFDRQMRALEEFDTTLTLCFTPEHLGVQPHYTSPPRDYHDFAEFTAWAVERYAAHGAQPAVLDHAGPQAVSEFSSHCMD
jgi:beta-xylosidase